jgi:hypothetical protein
VPSTACRCSGPTGRPRLIRRSAVCGLPVSCPMPAMAFQYVDISLDGYRAGHFEHHPPTISMAWRRSGS